MSKDFDDSAKKTDAKNPAEKAGAASTVSTAKPAAPNPFMMMSMSPAPKPPFGMPIMPPVATNLKVLPQVIKDTQKDTDRREGDK